VDKVTLSFMRFGECEPWIPKKDQEEAEQKILSKSEKLATCTSEFIKTLLAIRLQGCAEAEVIWNAACHVNVLSHDLNVFVHVIGTTSSTWTQRAIARAMITAMYEGCEDLLELYGKPFKETCECLGVWSSLESDCRTTLKQLARFRNRHERKWRSVRLMAGAHKDHDALAMLQEVANVSAGETVSQARELDDILRALGAFSMKAIDVTEDVLRKRGVLA
jgi:hypothetical protein